MPSTGGRIENNAVIGGYSHKMETYYIGKGQQGEATVVGKIVPSQKSLFVAYDGKEISFKNYEVLVYN